MEIFKSTRRWATSEDREMRRALATAVILASPAAVARVYEALEQCPIVTAAVADGLLTIPAAGPHPRRP